MLTKQLLVGSDIHSTEENKKYHGGQWPTATVWQAKISEYLPFVQHKTDIQIGLEGEFPPLKG